jgi:hypothetical protein
MSSATVLFVIRHILDLPAAGSPEGGDDSAVQPGGERICSMAFGPGLTVETALFTRLAAPPRAAAAGAAPGGLAAAPVEPVPAQS